VNLHWVTGSERNNDYFTIQRSRDGIDWEDITSVSGAGNSTSVIEYAATDNDPYFGLSYYRVKQTDFDGTETISGMKSVNNKYLSDIRLYPNPASTTLTVEYSEKDAEFSIFNQWGQALKTELVEYDGKAYINVEDLPNGVYLLKVVRNGFEQVERFVVRH